MKFEEPIIKIQKDDVLISKKGFLQQSPVTKKYYVFKKQRYTGGGCWMVIGDKEEVEIECHTSSKKR